MNSRMGLAAPEIYFVLVLFALMMIQVYFNNFLLLPKLLVKRKYVAYFISLFAWSLFIGCLYTVTIYQMVHYYPGTSESDISMVVASQTNKSITSAGGILHHLNNYTAFLLLMTFFFTMGWYMLDYDRQQKMLEATNKKQLETELLFLKGQINPHFLFNTMNNLYALAVKKSDQTPDAIMKLSAILRYLLYESDTQLVSFEKEKEVMQAYIDLELLRLTDKDNLVFMITADKPYNLPPLLWLPILENVFKHGTRFIADKYVTDYRFTIQNNQLTIYSRNNYKPSTQANETGRGGIGLSNLKHRLEILYPGKYAVTAGVDGDMYVVTVEISLK